MAIAILFYAKLFKNSSIIKSHFLSYPHLFFQAKFSTTDRILADAIDVRQALNAHVNLDQTTEVESFSDNIGNRLPRHPANNIHPRKRYSSFFIRLQTYYFSSVLPNSVFNFPMKM